MPAKTGGGSGSTAKTSWTPPPMPDMSTPEAAQAALDWAKLELRGGGEKERWKNTHAESVVLAASRALAGFKATAEENEKIATAKATAQTIGDKYGLALPERIKIFGRLMNDVPEAEIRGVYDERARVAAAAERARKDAAKAARDEARKVMELRIDAAEDQRDSFRKRNAAARKVRSNLATLYREFGDHPKWNEDAVREELEGGSTVASIRQSFKKEEDDREDAEKIRNLVAKGFRYGEDMGTYTDRQLETALRVGLGPKVQEEVEEELRRRRGGGEPQSVEDYIEKYNREKMEAGKGPLTEEEKQRIRARYESRANA